MKLDTIEDISRNSSFLRPTLDILNKVHRAFVHETVFNSIDIMLNIRPTFNTGDAWEKVVVRGEGGTCRLINLAAKHLLERIGFKCRCISSDVVHIHKTAVPKNSAIHMTMIVSIFEGPDCLREYIFDPGFGNSHRAVLPFNGEIIEDVMASYRVIYDEKSDLFAVQEKWDDWVTQFTFQPDNIMDEDSFDQHTYFTYEDNHFYKNNFYLLKCNEHGAIQLMNDRITILRNNGEVEVRSVLADGGIRKVLVEIFKLPKFFVDSIVTNMDVIPRPLQDILQKNWVLSEIAVVNYLRNSNSVERGCPEIDVNTP